MASLRRRFKHLWRRSKQATRPLRHAIIKPLLEGARLLAGALPHAWTLRLGGGLGRLAASVSTPQRRTARRQLEQAGLAPDPRRRDRICAEVFRQLGMNALEWLHSLRWTPEQIRDHVWVDDRDFACLQETLALGRGLIFVTGHMGNWEILPRAYHAYTGRIFAAVMAAPKKDAVLTQWLIKMREAGGQSRIFPVHEALSIMRHLRKGGTLALLADQDSTRSRGIFVDFFGRPAYTPVGPAHLARRTGAPLLPAAIVRDPADPCRHRVLMGEPLLADPALDEESDIERITRTYTQVLERWIREYPGQWVWIHERWRHQPGQRIRVRSAESRN